MSFKHTIQTLALGLSATLAATSLAAAQKPRPKVTEDSARAIAVREVPSGKVTASEYEHEKGRWIWSVELKVAGKSGIEEVNVDAMTGRVVSHEHESPKAEAKEARQEKGTKKS